MDLSKYPGESRLYDFDFSAQAELVAGQTLVSAEVTQSLAAGAGELTLGPVVISGGVVQVRISGGEAGAVHDLTCTAVTSAANILVVVGTLEVLDRTGTPVTDFYETLRFLTGDTADLQRRSDDLLALAVRSVVKLNKVPDYVLADGGSMIAPAVANPNDFALICFHAVRLFMLGSTEDDGVRAYAYTRRARREAWGSGLEVLLRLESDIYDLENGTLFVAWQSYLDYCEGKVGLPESLAMTSVQRDAPWQTITV